MRKILSTVYLVHSEVYGTGTHLRNKQTYIFTLVHHTLCYCGCFVVAKRIETTKCTSYQNGKFKLNTLRNIRFQV